MLVVHTREGHRPDLRDLPPHKKARFQRIGEPAPLPAHGALEPHNTLCTGAYRAGFRLIVPIYERRFPAFRLTLFVDDGDAGRCWHGWGRPQPRVLTRGNVGHDFMDELAPLFGEPVVDKPGLGAFVATGARLGRLQLGTWMLALRASQLAFKLILLSVLLAA